MNVDRPFSRIALLIILGVVLVGGILSLLLDGRKGQRPEAGALTTVPISAQFSPKDDLEETDINLIESAHEHIDIAMYAFTDTQIELALAQAARGGVRVRIYRDAAQFADEEARALRGQAQSVTDQLRGNRGVEIRVKGETKSMHLKAFCVDGRILRTGSANWSSSGETRQDNDLYIIQSPQLVQSFEEEFSLMWNRSDNRLVQ